MNKEQLRQVSISFIIRHIEGAIAAITMITALVWLASGEPALERIILVLQVLGTFLVSLQSPQR